VSLAEAAVALLSLASAACFYIGLALALGR